MALINLVNMAPASRVWLFAPLFFFYALPEIRRVISVYFEEYSFGLVILNKMDNVLVLLCLSNKFKNLMANITAYKLYN